MTVVIAAVMAAPAISEAEPSEHRAKETELRRGRLGIHEDKRKREGAK